MRAYRLEQKRHIRCALPVGWGALIAAAMLAGSAAQAQVPDVPLLTQAEPGALVLAETLAKPADVPRSFSEDEVRQLVDQILHDRDEKARQQAEQQKREAEERGYVVGSDNKMSAYWKEGVVVESAHKDFRMQIGARFNEDVVFFSEPTALEAPFPIGVGTLQDGTFFRRLRLQAKGQVWENVEFNMEFDFENIETRGTTAALGTTAFDHMWFGAKDVPVLGTVRVGNQRVPQSLEAYSDSKWLTFMERTAAFDAFMLDFAPGILVTNTAMDQHVTWHGMFHRCPGLAPRFSEIGTGADFGEGEWAATGRVTALPIYELEGRYLLHLGESYQWRRAKFDPDTNSDVIRMRARPEIRDSNGFAQESNNSRFIDTGLIDAVDTQLLCSEAMANIGSLNLRSEYYLVGVQNAALRNGNTTIPVGDLTYHGFYLQASYFLTGEYQPYDRRFGVPDRPRPLTNFFTVRTDEGCAWGSGLWEIAIRYTYLDLGAIGGGGGTGGGQLSDLNVGLNWWLNSSTKVQWNYIHANRNVLAPYNDGGVDAFGMRFAIDF